MRSPWSGTGRAGPGRRRLAVLLMFLGGLAVLACESGPDPVHESSYRDELRRYNEEILQLQRHIGSFRALAETYNTLPEQARRETFKDPNESLRRAEEEYSALQEKRDRLRARVLKKYGKLPEWWTDPAP